MGYKCDLCNAEEAAVFCFADNAAYCRNCDSRSHAGKLAKKHERVGLQREAESAVCDICQEHKAVMFCSEDRALICRRCDLMIHTANEFVAKHHRYLLSGMTVGLKALEDSSSPIADDASASSAASSHGLAGAGKARKPYGLRNTAASGREKESWSTAPEERISWRSSATNTEQPAAAPANLSHDDAFGSQPSLINMRAPASSPALASLPNANDLTTPFGRREEQFTDASQSATSPNGHHDASSSAAAFGGWGANPLGASSMQPNSADFTLAAELLGMPSVSQGFTAKDIDAAYIFDDDGDFNANLSALLEVPDLVDFQSGDPMLINEVGQSGPSALVKGPQKRGNPTDGVVPDARQDEIALKRQRI